MKAKKLAVRTKPKKKKTRGENFLVTLTIWLQIFLQTNNVKK